MRLSCIEHRNLRRDPPSDAQSFPCYGKLVSTCMRLFPSPTSMTSTSPGPIARTVRHTIWWRAIKVCEARQTYYRLPSKPELCVLLNRQFISTHTHDKLGGCTGSCCQLDRSAPTTTATRSTVAATSSIVLLPPESPHFAVCAVDCVAAVVCAVVDAESIGMSAVLIFSGAHVSSGLIDAASTCRPVGRAWEE
jgi:hypothetical protein